MIIVLTDANILIDLIELDLLKECFALDFRIHTNTAILSELDAEQLLALQPFLDSEKLHADSLSEEDLAAAALMYREKTGLSLFNCLALLQSEKLGATLLTSERMLHKFCRSRGVSANGHLWLFDQMILQGTLSGITASSKLELLNLVVNPKLQLPESDCNQYRNKWLKPSGSTSDRNSK